MLPPKMLLAQFRPVPKHVPMPFDNPFGFEGGGETKKAARATPVSKRGEEGRVEGGLEEASGGGDSGSLDAADESGASSAPAAAPSPPKDKEGASSPGAANILGTELFAIKQKKIIHPLHVVAQRARQGRRILITSVAGS